MKQTFNNLLLTILLLLVPQFTLANSILVLQSESLSNTAVISVLMDELQKKYPKMDNTLSHNITLAMGIESIVNALVANQRINIASGITEAELLQLIREFPNKLTQTTFVLSQAGFKCQMDLFKKTHAGAHQSLGILLKNETRSLYPLIKQYAYQSAITVTTWQSQFNESLADGLNQLMRYQDVVILLAQSEFNHSSQLSVIAQQAQILNKSLIAASEYQINSGISQGCVIKNKDWIISILAMIEQEDKNHTIKSNHSYSNELSKFKVIMPTVTIIE